MKRFQNTLLSWDIWQIKDKELLNLIIGREGGRTTVRIIDQLLKKPQNKNQLANKLNLDYNTITHHMKIMHNHKYVTKEKFDKSYFYRPSKKFFKSIDEYKVIRRHLLNKNLEDRQNEK
jgi:predicted transcriptional regulator